MKHGIIKFRTVANAVFCQSAQMLAASKDHRMRKSLSNFLNQRLCKRPFLREHARDTDVTRVLRNRFHNPVKTPAACFERGVGRNFMPLERIFANRVYDLDLIAGGPK